ncbi:MAG: hypothetical protein AB7G13_11670 [Lautropia sp.]
MTDTAAMLEKLEPLLSTQVFNDTENRFIGRLSSRVGAGHVVPLNEFERSTLTDIYRRHFE